MVVQLSIRSVVVCFACNCPWVETWWELIKWLLLFVFHRHRYFGGPTCPRLLSKKLLAQHFDNLWFLLFLLFLTCIFFVSGFNMLVQRGIQLSRKKLVHSWLHLGVVRRCGPCIERVRVSTSKAAPRICGRKWRNCRILQNWLEVIHSYWGYGVLVYCWKVCSIGVWIAHAFVKVSVEHWLALFEGA